MTAEELQVIRARTQEAYRRYPDNDWPGVPTVADVVRDDVPKLLAELDRLQRIERLAIAWQRAEVAFKRAQAQRPEVPLEEKLRLARQINDAEDALRAELREQEDDGHGRQENA